MQPHRGHSSKLLFQRDKQRAVVVEASIPPPEGPREPKPKKKGAPKAFPPPAPKAPAKPLKAKPRIAFDQLLDRLGLLKVPLTAPADSLRSFSPPFSTQSTSRCPNLYSGRLEPP